MGEGERAREGQRRKGGPDGLGGTVETREEGWTESDTETDGGKRGTEDGEKGDGRAEREREGERGRGRRREREIGHAGRTRMMLRIAPVA